VALVTVSIKLAVTERPTIVAPVATALERVVAIAVVLFMFGSNCTLSAKPGTTMPRNSGKTLSPFALISSR
jgi:hypothetical protein